MGHPVSQFIFGVEEHFVQKKVKVFLSQLRQLLLALFSTHHALLWQVLVAQASE